MPRTMPMPSPGSSRATRTHSQKFGTAFASWRRSSLAAAQRSFMGFQQTRCSSFLLIVEMFDAGAMLLMTVTAGVRTAMSPQNTILPRR
jgi:hypothetical protein